jgi:phospholipase D-like protein
MDAHFTSGGAGARDSVMEAIARIVELPLERSVSVHLMAFSFTDQTIACALLDLARSRPRIRIRMIADWGQRRHFPSVIPAMIENAPPNLEVRFTRDQPYFWDCHRSRVQWSYHVSLGFLHHKTLLILVDGQPFSLVCGSSNWTLNATKSYENTLNLSADSVAEAASLGSS